MFAASPERGCHQELTPMPHEFHCTRPDPPRKTIVPFAALPHHIAADPRLTAVDIRVLAALLFFAKDKPVAWPSDSVSFAARN
jgi:hypothetical protein